MSSVEARVQVLEDTEAIRRLKLRYARRCDDHYDADGLAALFTEDATWDAGELGVFTGREAIRAYWAANSARIPFAIHFISNHVVDIGPSGDEATGTAYLWEPLTIGDLAMWSAVVYTESYRKIDGDWFFARMELETAFLTPYDEGWAKQRFLIP
jgi:ketosteroid isomerase-like protein